MASWESASGHGALPGKVREAMVGGEGAGASEQRKANSEHSQGFRASLPGFRCSLFVFRFGSTGPVSAPASGPASAPTATWPLPGGCRRSTPQERSSPSIHGGGCSGAIEEAHGLRVAVGFARRGVMEEKLSERGLIVAEDAGNEADDGIHQDHRGEFTARVHSRRG